MDIDRFKHQHVDILDRIAALRGLAHRGVQANAEAIASQVKQLGTVVTLHLAIEDRILYPNVRQSADQEIANMGEAYQSEMKGIASAFRQFTKRWSEPGNIVAHPDAFREAANTVLREVFMRMQRENREFYPAIERL